MTTLSGFQVTDGVTDVLAAQYNLLLGSILRGEISNGTSMVGTVALTDSDTAIQRFECNGANRIVTLPAQANANHPFFIINVTSATYTLNVQSSGGVSFTILAAGGTSVLMIPDGVAGYKMLSSGSAGGGGELKNSLINGGFDIFQMSYTPGTLFTVADKGFGADRWQQFAENASWQAVQGDGTAESVITSKAFVTWKKITNTGKGIFAQKIEGVNAVPLRGDTVIFQVKLKASASKTIRIGIGELQNAGTIDTFPAAIASGFGGNTVDPTWGANLAMISGSPVSCSVTTSWQSFSVTATVPANSKNVFVVIFTDSQFAANDTLSAAEAGLFVASTVQAWTPRPLTQEQQLCARYLQAYYNEAAFSRFNGVGTAANTTDLNFSMTLPVQMRISPAVTFSNFATFEGSDTAAAGVLTAIATDATLSSSKLVFIKASKTTSFTQFRPYFLEAANQTAGAAFIILNAEL